MVISSRINIININKNKYKYKIQEKATYQYELMIY